MSESSLVGILDELPAFLGMGASVGDCLDTNALNAGFSVRISVDASLTTDLSIVTARCLQSLLVVGPPSPPNKESIDKDEKRSAKKNNSFTDARGDDRYYTTHAQEQLHAPPSGGDILIIN